MSTPTSSTGSGGGGGRLLYSNNKDQKDVTSTTVAVLKTSPQSPENNFTIATTSSNATVAANPASSLSSRLFTVSVVGLSGSEKEKGSVGVGKSCLCNRFVRPLEDEFRRDHISTLSQVDFGGRVVNNDHWLYWGERSLIADDGAELSFRLIEQTEFVDDESFQTLKGSGGQREPYAKRCCSVRLQSADKLMYICKDQLGLESEYCQKSLPDGKSNVDGFICVYDNSFVPNRPVERQTEFVAQILQNILKTKKPVVFVTTKNDEADERCVKEAEKLVARKEFKNVLHVVETSSLQNVNVESGFILLAHLIEKTRGKPKLMNFSEALRSRREIVDVATTAYEQKLRSAVQDHRLTWAQLCRVLERDSDFQHFCELCGRARAQKLYRQHQRKLRDHYVQRRLQKQAGRLPDILPHLVPDLNVLRGKTWEEVLEILPSLPQFNRLFQPVGTLAANADLPSDLAATSGADGDFRLSAEILYTPEAEECFRNYVNNLETDFRRRKLQEEFLQLLTGCSQVTPGKPLADLRIFFIGKECFESLSETDLQSIYDHYQRQLIKKSRRDFEELLQESVEEFVSRVLFRNSSSSKQSTTTTTTTNSSSTLGGAGTYSSGGSGGGGNNDKSRYLPGCLNEMDMRDLHTKLQEDVRYRQLNRLHQARDNMICQYVGFLSYPLRQHCPAAPRCIDTLVENLLDSKIHRSHIIWNENSNNGRCDLPSSINHPLTSGSGSNSSLLNLVIFGVDGLPNQLVREIQMFINDDEFQFDGVTYGFNYRCIDGDLSLPHNFLCSPHFQPHGLVCVFSSRSSLEFVRESFVKHLSHLLRPPPAHDDRSTTLVGLPVVFLLACDPSYLDDLPYLQQQGARLADGLRCSYVGLEPSTSHMTADRRARSAGGLFTEDQIQRVLKCFVCSSTSSRHPPHENNRRISSYDNYTIDETTASDLTPSSTYDVKLLICLMCGDDYSPELVLSPLLNYQSNNGSSSYSSTTNGNETSWNKENGAPPTANNLCNGRSYASFQNEAGLDRKRTFVVETFLPNLSRKLRAEITVTAYHTGFVWLAEHVYHHGYILVYSAKRRASLSSLYTFAHLIPDVIPLLVIAVGEVAEFFSDPSTNLLITEGNDIADRVGARFQVVSKADETQISVYTPFLDEVWAKKEEIEQNGLVKIFSGTDPPTTATSWNDVQSPYLRQNQKVYGTDLAVEEPTSHYAHLSQFASGWPANMSPDVGKMRQNNYETGKDAYLQYHQRTTPCNNRTTSKLSTNDVNDSMSRSYVSQTTNDPSPVYGDGQQVAPQSASVYVGKRQLSNCNLSTYEQSPSTSSNSNLAMLNSGGEWARNRRLVLENNSRQDVTTPVAAGEYSPSPRRDEEDKTCGGRYRNNRGSLFHLHRQATSEIEIYYGGGGSPDCNRPQHSLAHSLRRTLFGWWESGSEGALAKSGGYNSSSQANTPLGGGSPMSVREMNGGKKSKLLYAASFGTATTKSEEDKLFDAIHHFSERSSPRPIPTGGHQQQQQLAASSTAPLATPENIEVGVDYMTVKDALGGRGRDDDFAGLEDEEQYATVASVLPPRDQSKPPRTAAKKAEVQLVTGDSSSGESLEKTATVYEKTGRKPTPHRRDKKKSSTAAVGPTIAERVRQLNAAFEVTPNAAAAPANSSPPPPPVPPYTRERLFKSSGAGVFHVSIATTSVLRSSASEESLLDHHHNHSRLRDVSKRRIVNNRNNFSMRQKTTSPSGSPSLIRRMASSFRFRRGEKLDGNEEMSSKSVPQSPVFSERVFVLPPFQGGVAIEQPSDSSGFSIWLNPSSKLSSGSSSISPKRNAANEKQQQKNERKISRDIVKKYSGELPGKLKNEKKRSSKEGNQSQLVPPEANLKDLSPSEADPIPIFVRKCVDFIEAEGLTMEGIYRVPGNQAHVMLLEQRFAEDPTISFHAMDIPVNAVATALKNFFSYLSEPVFPYSVYDDLMMAMNIKNTDEKLNRIKEILSRLQPENRAVLRFFIAHLRKVAHHAHMTAMDHRNLAKCWWPTLLRPDFDSFETMAQMTQRLEELVQILLDNPHLI